jgi:hypothetical protein
MGNMYGFPSPKANPACHNGNGCATVLKEEAKLQHMWFLMNGRSHIIMQQFDIIFTLG